MELVRISTAGSVDDGKSTLIGRLLYDHEALTVEQKELIEKKSAEKGWKEDLDFSVLTDGLVAEREQGITIDVAHIYFSTGKRKFIVADSPGHVEYTRNMVTGASVSDISIILVDARTGLKEQSFRHFFISALIKVKKVVFCVNKMDLIDYSEDRFIEIAAAIQQMVRKLNADIPFSIVPISSLKGANVVQRSHHTSWYKGETLDELLHVDDEINDSKPFRFDVQQVAHVQSQEFVDYRAFQGRVLSGTLSVGDNVTALPSGKSARVSEIHRFKEQKTTIDKGDSVSILLDDQIDISRGTLLVKSNEIPEPRTALSATLVWMDERPANPGAKLLLKGNSREIMVKLKDINHTVEPSTFELNFNSTEIRLNDIAEVELILAQSIYLDTYTDNPGNGSFILIDTMTNNTVAVGFVKG